MNIRELMERTGVAERQVRYLVAEGLMPSPRGGRANADYGEDHVDAIRRYQRLRDLGFPPAAIKLLLESGQGVPFPVAPGVTLVIDPDRLGPGEPVEPLITAITRLLTDLFQENTNAADRASEPTRD